MSTVPGDVRPSGRAVRRVPRLHDADGKVSEAMWQEFANVATGIERLGNREHNARLLADVVRSYVRTLLAATSCRGEVVHGTCRGELCDRPLLGFYADSALFNESRVEIAEIVWRFIAAHADDVRDWVDLHPGGDRAGMTGPEDFGYQLVMSRNGNGTGFWDCGRGALGDRLHAAAVELGEMNLYVGDDGHLYV